MPKLVVRRGPEIGKVYPLTADSILIGRGSRNEIVIEDNEVSREHCRLMRVNTHYELSDLGSSNGTFVNGQRLSEPWLLRADCLIELGDSITLAYHLTDEAGDGGELPGEAETQTEELFFVVTVVSQPNRAIYPLRGETVDIGRGVANDIIIVEAEMSRNHMRLKRTDKGYVLIDLNSTNGTSVNGVDVRQPTLLTPGDVIRVGTTITIQYTTNPEAFLAGKPPSKSRRDPVSDEMLSTQRNPLKALGVTTFLNPQVEPSKVGTGVEPEALADQVLVVYDRADWESVVAPLMDALYQADVPAWVEQYLTPGGEDWYAAIEQARLECWLLLVVVTPGALALDYVLSILRHFHNREKPILLMIHQPVERLPVGANHVPQIGYNAAQPQQTFNQIVRAITQLRERRKA